MVFALKSIHQNDAILFGRPDSGHPPGTQTDVLLGLVGISLILLCRAWSKLDVQVVVCNWVGDPFKTWVAGSSPAALTIVLVADQLLSRFASGLSKLKPNRRGFSPITAAEAM